VRFSAERPDGDVEGDGDRAALLAHMRERIASCTLEELLTGARTPGVSFSPVHSIDELLASEQAATRRSVVTVPDGELGDVAVAAVVPRFARTPGAVRHASPVLDAHRADIRADWGIDAT
jgi:formyl-CoA transferase